MNGEISGAIFTEDQRDSATELAFKHAVYKINKDKTLLPYTSLVYDIQYVPRDDSFHASKKGEWTAITKCSVKCRICKAHLHILGCSGDTI